MKYKPSMLQLRYCKKELISRNASLNEINSLNERTLNLANAAILNAASHQEDL
jgi:hypothetical protein